MDKYCHETKVIRTKRVFPNEINHFNTLFGGVLMYEIDVVASISAAKLCLCECATVSTDSVEFLRPILPTDAVCLESFISWTDERYMEVFVKITTENLRTGQQQLAATAFLTFVALDENGKPRPIPQIRPSTDEEYALYFGGNERARLRKERRKSTYAIAEILTV